MMPGRRGASSQTPVTESVRIGALGRPEITRPPRYRLGWSSGLILRVPKDEWPNGSGVRTISRVNRRKLALRGIGMAYPPNASTRILAFGPFRPHPARRSSWREYACRAPESGSDIRITLAARPRELVSKDELIARVWPNTFVEKANLRVHIGGLRQVLSDGQSGVRYVTGVPGRGYSFTAPATQIDRQHSGEAAEPAPNIWGVFGLTPCAGHPYLLTAPRPLPRNDGQCGPGGHRPVWRRAGRGPVRDSGLAAAVEDPRPMCFPKGDLISMPHHRTMLRSHIMARNRLQAWDLCSPFNSSAVLLAAPSFL